MDNRYRVPKCRNCRHYYEEPGPYAKVRTSHYCKHKKAPTENRDDRGTWMRSNEFKYSPLWCPQRPIWERRYDELIG